jgi:chromosome segregation ATPase
MPRATTPDSVEVLATEVERLEAELAELQGQAEVNADTLAVLRDKSSYISTRKAQLSLAFAQQKPEAIEEVRQLRTDAQDLADAIEMREAAAFGLKDQIEATKERLRQAEHEVYKAQASATYARLKEAEHLLDALGEPLLEALAEVGKLSAQYNRDVRRYRPQERGPRALPGTGSRGLSTGGCARDACAYKAPVL